MFTEIKQPFLIRHVDSSDFIGNVTKLPKKINEYLIVKKIGAGSFSKVLLGINESTNIPYALKRFRIKDLQKIFGGISQIERDINNMKLFSHPNILHLNKILLDRINATVYLVLEFADYGSLEYHKAPIEVIQSIFYQILVALKEIHSKHFVHQDIKPSNILLSSDGRAIVADFGLGHSFESTDKIVGSPAYQAPEALIDDPSERKFLDPSQEDIWSLGVTLFETLFGYLPYQGESVFEINRQIRTQPLEIPLECGELAKDLLEKMLDVDSRTRISVEQAQNHPFFSGALYRFEFQFKLIEYPIYSPQIQVQKIEAEVFEGEFSFQNEIFSLIPNTHSSSDSFIYSNTFE